MSTSLLSLYTSVPHASLFDEWTKADLIAKVLTLEADLASAQALTVIKSEQLEAERLRSIDFEIAFSELHEKYDELNAARLHCDSESNLRYARCSTCFGKQNVHASPSAVRIPTPATF